MSFKKAFDAVLAAFCLLLAHPARAEEWTRKSFLMPKGSFEITGDPARPALLEINASQNSFGRPVHAREQQRLVILDTRRSFDSAFGERRLQRLRAGDIL